MLQIYNVLQIPDTVTCSQRSVCNGIEGIRMPLKCLPHPCRYGDRIIRFPKPVIVLSMVTNQTIHYVYNIPGYKVLQWNCQVSGPPNMQTFDDAVTVKGAPLPNCYGFIDGTVRPISGPGEQQINLCNGF